jgi:hypothetical protein
MPTPLPGFSTTLTFQTGFFSMIQSPSWGGMAREALDTTNMSNANGAMTSIPSKIFNPGTLKIAGFFNPDIKPPLTTQVAETCTLTFPIPTGKTNAATWVAQGYLTDFEFTADVKTLWTFTGTLTFTGDITVTASS